MNLYNALPTPLGIRKCYWDAEYIASQPFCITTRITDKESRQMADFEEMCLFEGISQLREELQQEIDSDAGEMSDSSDIAASVIDAKKVVAEWQSLPKRFYFYRTNWNEKHFGLYNIQSSDGLPTKTGKKQPMNRTDYLSR